jgi:lipopolysaccharide/colanic/teichoic acid biosynthesis glycosyltransferase
MKYSSSFNASEFRSRVMGARFCYATVKRCFDIAVTLTTAPLLLMLVGALAVLVRLDGGPAFFWQLRVGRGGKLFKLWKLRTMVPDADLRLGEHLARNPKALAEWTRCQKLANDPRITRIGFYLRKYSLDELPQLFNVLLGDMSLVGPRPMLPEQRSLYPDTAYFSLRPGMTGLWQVSERNACTFAERAQIDTRYARTFSFRVDLWILVLTPLVVLKGTGI